MMKVTPLAPWSSISFFKDEMLFRLCFPIIVSGYLRAGSRDVKCIIRWMADQGIALEKWNTLNFGWGWVDQEMLCSMMMKIVMKICDKSN